MDLAKVHRTSLEMATWLSNNQVKNAVAPLDIIRRFAAITSNSVLVGTYGLVGWMREPRATQTVEVLVALSLHRKAADELLRAFPQLEADRREEATHIRDKETGTVTVRVVKPLERRYQATLRRTYAVRWKGCSCRLPSLEMALVLTYVPMMTLPRDDADKYQNAHDFILLAKANPEFDLKKLASIAEVVCPDGRDDLLERVKGIQTGKPFHLSNSIVPHG